MGFLGSFVSGDLSAVSLLGITASLPLVVLLSQRRRIPEPRRRWHRIVPSLGPTLLIVVTVAYTVWIGGDHMNGRFYLPILTLSAFAYVLHERELPEDWRRISRTVLVSASLLSPVLNGQATRLPGLARFGTTVPYALTPLRHVNERDECWRFGGSLDEKCAYKHRTYFWGNAFVEEHGQVLAWLYEPSRSTHEAVELAPVGAGHASLLVGPNRTKWDDQGLSDQFQARMPVIRGTSWRAGHFIKFHPREERWASFVAGTGRFGDRELDQLFNAVHLVATGPLWSAERWREIARLNLGGYASVLSTIGARYGRPTPENCRRSIQPHLCLRDIGRPGSCDFPSVRTTLPRRPACAPSRSAGGLELTRRYPGMEYAAGGLVFRDNPLVRSIAAKRARGRRVAKRARRFAALRADGVRLEVPSAATPHG
jgi:hypothetical protein